MKRLLLLFVVAVLATGGWLGYQWRTVPPLDLSEPKGGEFTLTAKNGPVSLSDYRGKVALIYFGYTFCPDICPTNLALITQALNGLEPGELERVQPIFISVDPDRDSVDQLARYTEYFHPSIIGVTGKAEDIAEVANRYGAAYRKVEGESAGGYLVDHTSMTYVVSTNGELARTLPHAAPPPDIIATIRELLNESS